MKVITIYITYVKSLCICHLKQKCMLVLFNSLFCIWESYLSEGGGVDRKVCYPACSGNRDLLHCMNDCACVT